MKHLMSIATLAALAVFAVGCSKEEATPAEEPAAVEEQPVADDIIESAVTENESLEVVEESAAVADPGNEKIILAKADDVAAPQTWKFREGQHFNRMIPTQPTFYGADKIEVAEVFMYSCPHCYDLEAFINQWEQTKNSGVRLVRIPAIFNQMAQMHAKLFYTETFLAKSGKLQDHAGFRSMVFEEIHRRGNRLSSENAIQRLFERAGVSGDDFGRTWNSFEVDQALRRARDLARRYGIDSVPTIIVNGKYSADASSAGSYPKLIELIDELTVREGLR